MRSGFAIALIITLLSAGGYIYYLAEAVCPVPIDYRIGEVDERFGLSREEVRAVLAEAEAVWEESTNRELFQYQAEGDGLVINFLFDQRQARTLAEEELRADLDAQQERSEVLNEQYQTLRDEYETKAAAFNQAERDYTTRLSQYNDTVASYNDSGGAPPEVFAELEAKGEALEAEATALNSERTELATLVDRLNALGAEGNAAIEQYNENVKRYNNSFAESAEFTQGDYQSGSISIYTFADREELVVVLAHEFGHALGVEHVEGAESVMYYLLGAQPKPPILSSTDHAAFVAQCGETDHWWPNLRVFK